MATVMPAGNIQPSLPTDLSRAPRETLPTRNPGFTEEILDCAPPSHDHHFGQKNLDYASQALLHPGYASCGPNDDHGRPASFAPTELRGFADYSIVQAAYGTLTIGSNSQKG